MYTFLVFDQEAISVETRPRASMSLSGSAPPYTAIYSLFHFFSPLSCTYIQPWRCSSSSRNDTVNKYRSGSILPLAIFELLSARRARDECLRLFRDFRARIPRFNLAGVCVCARSFGCRRRLNNDFRLRMSICRCAPAFMGMCIYIWVARPRLFCAYIAFGIRLLFVLYAVGCRISGKITHTRVLCNAL